MVSTVEISAAQRQRAHDYYFHRRTVTVPDIATYLGVSEAEFRRLRRSWSWPPRREALAQAGQTETGEAGGEPTDKRRSADDRTNAASSLREAALSLAQVTRRRIEALVKDRRSSRHADHEKTARTLASLAKTLTTARSLLEQEDSKADDIEPKNESHRKNEPHRSINELRDELARHLERIVAEEETDRADGRLV